jgi:hypothetical protein
MKAIDRSANELASLADAFSASLASSSPAIPGSVQEWRLAVLASAGFAELPKDLESRASYLRGWARTWAKYLRASRDAGLLDGNDGKHLLARLNGKDRADFYSALDECGACWLLTTQMGFEVLANPAGRNGTRLELRARHGDVSFAVEVKSPYNLPPMQSEPPFVANQFSAAPLLSGCVRRDAEKFKSDEANVAIVFPRVALPVEMLRDELVRALFGKILLVIPRPPAPPRARREFVDDGLFTKVYEKTGRPRHTRISAVVAIGQSTDYRGTDAVEIEHQILVAQNPNARRPVRASAWGNAPAVSLKGDILSWSDHA